jgi:hypothetical protein
MPARFLRRHVAAGAFLPVTVKTAKQPHGQAEQYRQQDNKSYFPKQHSLLPLRFFRF